MSKRPIEEKQRRRVARLLRKNVKIQAYIDPVEWLVNNRHARTRKEARQLISEGLVTADGAVLHLRGSFVPTEDGKQLRVTDTGLVRAELRDKLRVESE